MLLLTKINKRISRILKFLIYTRSFYTFWFNFRYLPFSQAKKLPIIFFPHAFAKVEKGARITIGPEVLNNKSQKVFIGEDMHDFAHFSERTYLHVAGSITFTGKVHILRGAFVEVFGSLSIGEDVFIPSLCRIRAYNKIIIGNHVRLTHETQLFDTNFHYVTDVNTMQFRPMSKPIVIGDYVWIGNRSTISAGAIIPSYTIVASNSLVNKDMSDLKPYTIIGGMPCRVLREGQIRIWDDALEAKWFQREFGYIIPLPNPIIW